MAKKYKVPGGQLYRPIPEEVTIIGVDTDDDTHHPFHYREHAPVTDELLESIEQAGGVVNPIRVYKDDEGRMVVVSGCRRTLALRTINERRQAANGAPSMAIDAVDCPSFAEALAVRNAANENGATDPPSKRAEIVATSYEHLRLKDPSRGAEDIQREIAGWYGIKHPKTIRTWMHIAGMSQAVKDALDAGDITQSQAVEWLKTTDSDGTTRDTTHEEQDALLDDFLNPPQSGGEGAPDYFKPSKKFFKFVLENEDLKKQVGKPVAAFMAWIADPKNVDPSTVKGISDACLQFESENDADPDLE